MRYFRNSDLIHIYSVADKTVRNWIDAAQHGKNDLELYELGKKYFIIDSVHNEAILNKLVERGRKYRNERAHKLIKPQPLFYSLLGPEGVQEVIHDLESKAEIPQHYRHRGKGGVHWDAYLKKLHESGSENILTIQRRLLALSYPVLDELVNKFDNIRIVDLGVGNGLAAREVISHFQASGKLQSYIGVDISDELLAVTSTNIKKWFPELEAAYLNRNIFTDKYRLVGAQSNVLSIFLLLGGTIVNTSEPIAALTNIASHMHQNDLLVSATKLDTEKSRRFFDFNLDADATAIPPHTQHLLDLLNITSNLYDVEQFYDEQKARRVIQVRLKVALTLHFDNNDINYSVHFQKGEPIVLWIACHYSGLGYLSLCERSNFKNIQTLQTRDGQFLLNISANRQTRNYYKPTTNYPYG